MRAGELGLIEGYRAENYQESGDGLGEIKLHI